MCEWRQAWRRSASCVELITYSHAMGRSIEKPWQKGLVATDVWPEGTLQMYGQGAFSLAGSVAWGCL